MPVWIADIYIFEGQRITNVLCYTFAQQDAETSSILQLPLAGDMYMAHTLQIAMRYYRDVLAGT